MRSQDSRHFLFCFLVGFSVCSEEVQWYTIWAAVGRGRMKKGRIVMQITEKVRNCNGCSACIVGCRYSCIHMVEDENGYKQPLIDENGCSKCNNCVLYCPLYMPVELPLFETYYEYDEQYYHRDMPKVYRETIRAARAGNHIQFVGTLCQIAGLKSLMGDKLPPNVQVAPLYCDPEDPKRPECVGCTFWKK